MVNKVILVGNLGTEPELKQTSGASQLCTFSVATSEKWTHEGEKKEKTEWHKVVVWGKLAENCAKHLNKGKKVYVEGKLATRSWEDDSGEKRYVTEVVASTVNFL